MYTDEVRVRLVPCSSHSKRHGWSFHLVFFFRRNVTYVLFQKHEGQFRRKRSCVLMLSKCGKGSVGEGETGERSRRPRIRVGNL